MNLTQINGIIKNSRSDKQLENVRLFEWLSYPHSWLKLTTKVVLIVSLLLITSCVASQHTVVVKETARVNNVVAHQENIVYDANNRPAERISGELLGKDNYTVNQQYDVVYIDNGYPYPRYYDTFYDYQYFQYPPHLLPYPHRHGSYRVIPHIRHMHSARHHIAHHHHGGHHRGFGGHRRH